MTMDEAIVYLKSIKEWESVWKLERDTILKWAEFLKNKEMEEKKTIRKKTVKA